MYLLTKSALSCKIDLAIVCYIFFGDFSNRLLNIENIFERQAI